MSLLYRKKRVIKRETDSNMILEIKNRDYFLHRVIKRGTDLLESYKELTDDHRKTMIFILFLIKVV